MLIVSPDCNDKKQDNWSPYEGFGEWEGGEDVNENLYKVQIATGGIEMTRRV